MNQKTIRWIAGTAILPLMISGCQLLPAEETFPQPTLVKTFDQAEYTTTKVQRGDLVKDITVTGKQVAKVKYDLTFGVGGERIGEVYVSEGELVSKGQLLMELEQLAPSEELLALQERVENAQLEKAYLEENMTLEEKLQNAKLAVIDEKLASVRAQIKAGKNVTELKAQEADLVEDREDQEKEKTQKLNDFSQKIKQLADTLYIDQLRLDEMKSAQTLRQIYSPIDGMVTNFHVSGFKIDQGETAITISDMTTAYFQVETDATSNFPVGEKVVIVGDNKTAEAVCVSATEIGMPETSYSGMPLVYFQLVEPDPTLRTGSITRVLDSRSNVLYVEKSAIRIFTAGKKVYIIGEDGVRQPIDVETGLEVDGYVEIVSGPDEGTELILS